MEMVGLTCCMPLVQLFVTSVQKSASICDQFKVDRRTRAAELIQCVTRKEEVLTDTIAAQINDAAGLQRLKGLKMQSTTMTFVRQCSCPPKTFSGMICAVAIGFAGFATTATPASALVTGASNVLQDQLKRNSPVV